MKLRIKIIAGYLILAALLIALGKFGEYFANRIAGEFDAATQRTLPVMVLHFDERHALGEILRHASHVMEHTAGTRKAGDLHRKEALVAISHARARLESALLQHQELAEKFFPDELTELAEASAQIRAFNLQIHAFVASGKPDDYDTANETLEAIFDAFDDSIAAENE